MGSKTKGLKTQEPLKTITKVGSLLSEAEDIQSLVSILVEQSLDGTRSDLCCLYLYDCGEGKNQDLLPVHTRGRFPAPVAWRGKWTPGTAERFESEVPTSSQPSLGGLRPDSELTSFIRECDEAVVLLENKKSPFHDLFLTPDMKSGIALPLSTGKTKLGMLILNSRYPFFYNREKLLFLESIARMTGGMISKTLLCQQLRERVRQTGSKMSSTM
ncbi:MAG TPA: GAF domain-containing protein [Spirochaetia bacterium]|nr:GAF domain-containing protein [Spirochaetia bacterium]